MPTGLIADFQDGTAKDKINETIARANAVEAALGGKASQGAVNSEASSRTAADATERAERVAAVAAVQQSVNVEIAARQKGDADGLATLAREKAAFFALAQQEAAARLAGDAARPTFAEIGGDLTRPGVSARLYTGDITAPVADASSWPASGIVVGPDGPVALVSGAGEIAPVAHWFVEPDHDYRVRFVLRRRRDPDDPQGDAVQLGFACFSRDGAHIATVTGVNLFDVDVGAGRVEHDIKVSITDSANVDMVLPAGTRSIRPYLRTFGNGETMLELIDRTDLTLMLDWSPDVSALARKMSGYDYRLEDVLDRLNSAEFNLLTSGKIDNGRLSEDVVLRNANSTIAGSILFESALLAVAGINIGEGRAEGDGAVGRIIGDNFNRLAIVPTNKSGGYDADHELFFDANAVDGGRWTARGGLTTDGTLEVGGPAAFDGDVVIGGNAAIRGGTLDGVTIGAQVPGSARFVTAEFIDAEGTRDALGVYDKAHIDRLLSSADAMLVKGAIDASTNPNYPPAEAGWLFVITAAGKIGGADGVEVKEQDVLLCKVDGSPGGTHAEVGADWNVKRDIPYASQPAAEVGLDNNNIMTALRVKQQVFEPTMQKLLGARYEPAPAGAALGMPGIVQRMDGQLYKLARNGQLTVKDVGAVGDFNTTTQTGADDYARFMEALNFVREADSSGKAARGKFHVPAGMYRLSQPFIVPEFGVQIEGEGAVSTYIVADHANGSGVQVCRSRSSVKGLTIGASTARKTMVGSLASRMAQIGLLCEPPAGVNHVAFVEFHDVLVQDQPGHGIVGGGSGMTLALLEARNNGGHGIALDAGKLTGRPDAIYAGWSDLVNFRANGNGGHGLAVGHPDDAGTVFMFRVRAKNGDVGGNCLDPAVRYCEEQIYLAGAGIVVADCGVAGKSFFVAGETCSLEDNRHPDTTLNVRVGVHAGLGANGIRIARMHQTGNTLAGPAVVVDPAVTGYVEIDQPRTSTIATLFSGPVKKWKFGTREKLDGGVFASSSFRGTDSFVVPDDGVAVISMSQASAGRMQVIGTVGAARAASFHFGALATPFCLKDASTAADIVASTAVLNGTTGVDGQITFSAASDGKCYLENRSGSARTYSLALFSTSPNLYIAGVTV